MATDANDPEGGGGGGGSNGGGLPNSNAFTGYSDGPNPTGANVFNPADNIYDNQVYSGLASSQALNQFQSALYNDYNSRFRPMIENLLDKNAAAAELNRRLGRVKVGTQQSQDMARLTGAQALARTGTNMTADQSEVMSRNSALNDTLAQVTGDAGVRRGFQKEQDDTRNMLIQLGRGQLGQNMTTLDQLAATETDRNAYNSQAQANATAQDNQTNTQLASMAIMMYMMSSEKLKENIMPVNVDAALHLVENTPIYSFNYKAETGIAPIEQPFIGPIAEESPRVITNDQATMVNLYNMVGLLYGSVQALVIRIEQLEAELKDGR